MEPRAASLSALVSAVPRSWSAGASPNTIPVAIAIASVKLSAVSVGLHVVQQRNADRVQPRQRAGAGNGQQQPQERAAARQHDALGQQLRQQAAASGAEGGANRHFLLPCRGPRQQQVGEVGADDQHHHPDRAREHPDREPDAAADLFGERLDVALEAVAFRMLARTIWPAMRADLRLRLRRP